MNGGQPVPEPSKDHLFDEYKIVQDKIDKIGNFKFTIRGWAITVASAGLVATMSPSVIGLYPLVLCPVFLLFWAVEYYELNVRRVLIARAIVIEVKLGRNAPRMAQSIVQDDASSKSVVKSLVRFVNTWFYVFLIVVLLFGMWVRYASMRRETQALAIPGKTTPSIIKHSDELRGSQNAKRKAP